MARIESPVTKQFCVLAAVYFCIGVYLICGSNPADEILDCMAERGGLHSRVVYDACVTYPRGGE